MNEQQQETLKQVRRRVLLAREGGQADWITRATLIAEGWPAGAVLEALKEKPE